MATEEIITQEDNPHALIVRAPDEKSAILLMDRTDLDQAMAELRGEVLEGFVYVPKGGKKTLSYAGIKEAARLYRNVHFGATATPLPDGSWMITSYAHNLADNVRVDYPMPYPGFDPRDREAAIEFRASLSKSLRNALAAVLPVAYLSAMITRWMEHKGAGSAQDAPGLRTTSGAAKALAPAGPAPAHKAGSAASATVMVAPAGAQKPVARTGASARGDDASFAARAGAALRPSDGPLDGNADAIPEGLRAEVIALLERDGAALDLLKAKGTLPADMSAEQLRKAKDWLLERERRNVPVSVRLSRSIDAADTPEALRTAQQAVQQAKDRKGISQAEYVGLLQAFERRRTELSGPLTAQAGMHPGTTAAGAPS